MRSTRRAPCRPSTSHSLPSPRECWTAGVEPSLSPAHAFTSAEHPVQEEWALQRGWMRYGLDGSYNPAPHFLSSAEALVFDIESMPHYSSDPAMPTMPTMPGTPRPAASGVDPKPACTLAEPRNVVEQREDGQERATWEVVPPAAITTEECNPPCQLRQHCHQQDRDDRAPAVALEPALPQRVQNKKDPYNPMWLAFLLPRYTNVHTAPPPSAAPAPSAPSAPATPSEPVVNPYVIPSTPIEGGSHREEMCWYVQLEELKVEIPD
ncbi:hypothetical protein CALVIDRAFT_561655 [Calocera viscosa TUFC12733]|uniref:Uncharacterized protein n=1 Tax=Calocera viscosa (strain TUFC12733) TaxID=1330018 RepID=A0A167PEI8_CALVF|nr:hypothetical protein CALVIDRAFT_561655 [Calocera viscosa TUFC12733]